MKENTRKKAKKNSNKNKKKSMKKTKKISIIGEFNANEKGFGFVKPEKNEENRLKGILDENEDIFIPKEFTKDALNEDIVEVKIDLSYRNRRENGKRLEGKIVKVIRRGKKVIVGTFLKKNKNYAIVKPDDKKFLAEIFVPNKYFGKARNNHKVKVQITDRSRYGNYKLQGKVIEVIGGINEAGVDMLSLIEQYELPSTFPEEVVKEAKAYGTKINKSDIKNRRDLRKEIIFTIDGEDAKDLDDAVCVKKLKDGNYELDVHIADVSHYVRDRSKLDKEALLRGTSIYLLGRVIPMLPRELSNGICSLNAGEDRLTLSVTMIIDKEGNVISHDIYKAVINVTERMSYTDVQAILDNSNEATIEKYKKYIDEFKLMEELALILKKKRISQGYLNLEIPETKVELDINGKPTDIHKYETTFANEIIEQFMLKANETVAEHFYWLRTPFIYRNHETPDIEKIKELNKFLFNLGYRIPASGDNIQPLAFAKILDEIKGKPEEKVVSNLVLRTLKLAKYESENKGHFGIASKYYCHFTSPIRRYPDLFIHRIISEYFDMNEKDKERMADKAPKYAERSSDRERLAQKVEREAVSMKMAEYMEGKIGEIYDGVVSSVTGFGMFVELENTVEGLVRFEDMMTEGYEYFIFDEDNKQLIGEISRKVYKIGDKVKVQVSSASKESRTIDFKLVNDSADSDGEIIKKQKGEKKKTKKIAKSSDKNKKKNNINELGKGMKKKKKKENKKTKKKE